MASRLSEIPGYIVLAGIAVLALIVFGLSEAAIKIFSPHKSDFEELTSYQNPQEMMADQQAFEKQVMQQILEMGINGDTFKKADAGDAEAQYHVGNGYLYGSSMQDRDEKKAMEWFLKSAAQRYAPAEYQIGTVYANSHGDHDEAIKWYRKAAEDGDGWAQRNLGEMYFSFLAERFGLHQDFTEADFWLTLGTAESDPHSSFVQDRDSAEANLNAVQVSQVKKRLQEWRDAHPASVKR